MFWKKSFFFSFVGNKFFFVVNVVFVCIMCVCVMCICIYIMCIYIYLFLYLYYVYYICIYICVFVLFVFRVRSLEFKGMDLIWDFILKLKNLGMFFLMVFFFRVLNGKVEMVMMVVKIKDNRLV